MQFKLLSINVLALHTEKQTKFVPLMKFSDFAIVEKTEFQIALP